MRAVMVLLAVSACAAQEHRRALITDVIPLLTKRPVVEERLKGERLCLRRRNVEEDLYASCQVDPGERRIEVAVHFGTTQQARAIVVTVFILPKPFFGEPRPLYDVEEMSRRAFVAFGAELERRYGRGVTSKRGTRRWLLEGEMIWLGYSKRGHVHEAHLWMPVRRGPLIAGR